MDSSGFQNSGLISAGTSLIRLLTPVTLLTLYIIYLVVFGYFLTCHLLSTNVMDDPARVTAVEAVAAAILKNRHISAAV